MAGIRITATDLDTGESSTLELGMDDFCLIPTGKCVLASQQLYANGTVVLTLKGYRAKSAERSIPTDDPRVTMHEPQRTEN